MISNFDCPGEEGAPAVPCATPNPNLDADLSQMTWRAIIAHIIGLRHQKDRLQYLACQTVACGPCPVELEGLLAIALNT